MYLIQLFLPTCDNHEQNFPATLYGQVREELVEKFSGITAYTRAPAHGLWQPEEGRTMRDELVIYEVMAPELERAWWRTYKASLEQRFRQREILIRAQEIELLR